jgi:phosphoserine phosphatase
MKSRVVVVDLDQCLCSINTFRAWLFFSFLYLLFSVRWLSALKFTGFVVSRIFRRSDRVQMKRNILLVTEELPDHFIHLFCSILRLFTNDDVVAVMQQYQAKDLPVILCTAAPSCYVQTYSNMFNFTKVFATHSVFEEGWSENSGNEKLLSIQRYFAEGVVLECVITDHYDDLPLLREARRRILVRPTKLTLDTISGNFDFELM